MSNKELVEAIQAGQDVQDNLYTLYKNNKNYICWIAKPFAKDENMLDDLMQESFFGLIDTVKNCDPSTQGFLQLLKLNVKQHCLKYTEREYNQLTLHSYGRKLRLYNQLKGEGYSNQTIMEKMNLSQFQFDNLMQVVNMENITYLDTEIDNGEGENNTLHEVVGGDENIEDVVLNEIMDDCIKSTLWEQVDSLDDCKRNIIYLTYKLNLTENDIASNYGYTKCNVAIIKRKALEQLRHMEKIQELADMCGYDSWLAYAPCLSVMKNFGSSNVEQLALKHIELEERFNNKKKELHQIMDGMKNET